MKPPTSNSSRSLAFRPGNPPFCKRYTAPRTFHTRKKFSRVAQGAAFCLLSKKTIILARMSCFAPCLTLHRPHLHSELLTLLPQDSAPHVDRKFGGTELLAEIQFGQESFTEVLRHLCCEKVQARRVSSCHHFATIQDGVQVAGLDSFFRTPRASIANMIVRNHSCATGWNIIAGTSTWSW